MEMKKMEVFNKKMGLRIFSNFLPVFLLLLALIPMNLSAQEIKTVSGEIVDSQGEPLIGVTVLIEGTTNGTITDIDGRYSINVKDADVLVFSYIGFVSQNIPVQGKTQINVTLADELSELGEVVVIAYGTTSSKNFTGSTTQIKTENSPLAQIPATDAMSVLKGTVPGMTVSQEQGAGQSSSLLVRGQRSISSNDTNPLVVVDGVIYQGAWRDIDPSSIESMSVLKDATSIAAYGSRAANGVIMITSKKGKQGKPVITFNASAGVSHAVNKADVLSPEKYVEKVNILKLGDADADPTWMSDFEKENYENGKTIDWQDFMERTGSLQSYSLGISGAKENTNYYFGGSYNKTEGVVIGDDYSRISLNSRVNTDITSWLEIGTDVNFSFNDYSGPTTYDVVQAVDLTPYGRAYREGSTSLLEKYPRGESNWNPLWAELSGTVDDHDVYYTTVLKGHALVKCPWIEGLQYRLNYAYTIKNVERDLFYHEGYYVEDVTSDYEDRYSDETTANYLKSAYGSTARTNVLAYVWDNILSYSKSFGNHNIDVTAVYTRDSYDSKYKKFKGSDFSDIGNTDLGYNGLTYAGTQEIEELTNYLKTNIGYFGRVNYNYAGKYHLTASIRRDGASVLSEGHKWGAFPSVGLGWTISSEDFMSSLTAINYLKLKLSYGKNGNQSIDPYETISTITQGQTGGYAYPFGNTSEVSWGERISSVGNTDLVWEETNSLNGGFELTMLENKINLDVDAYTSKTENQIYERTIPDMGNGFTTMTSTMGQINNWGIEASLTTQNIKTADFSWNSTITFYRNRNKIKKLAVEGEDIVSSSLFIGKSLGAIYGYKNIGIVQEDDDDYISTYGASAGDVKFWDKDEDGDIDTDDRTILGYSKENFRMSFANTIDYKNLEVYFLFNGIFGGNGYYSQENLYAYQTYTDPLTNNGLNHGWWTSENKSNKYPGIDYSSTKYTPIMSRGFVRLQNLNISYTFKQPWVKSLNMENLRVFAAATNLFTITNWVGGDPESGQTVGGDNNYPLTSTYSIGLNLKF